MQQCRAMQNAQAEHISEMVALLDTMRKAEGPADALTQLEWYLKQIQNASENEASLCKEIVSLAQCAETPSLG